MYGNARSMAFAFAVNIDALPGSLSSDINDFESYLHFLCNEPFSRPCKF
jgi:hypothetical protein